MIIRTQYKNVNGTPKVLAKGGGRQQTVLWHLDQSTDWNHGNAAGTLGRKLGLGWSDSIEHDQSDDGCRHGFKFPAALPN